jgi:hypothetical protein
LAPNSVERVENMNTSPSRPMVILCQAPFYLQHTLSLYREACQAGKKVKIFVGAVPAMERFLNRLKLEAEITFLPSYEGTVKLGRPWSFLSLRRHFRRVADEHFRHFTGSDFYFSGCFNHFTTMAVIAAMQGRGNLLTDFGYEPHDLAKAARTTWRQRLRHRLVEWTSGVPLKHCDLGGSDSLKGLLLLDRKRCGVATRCIPEDPNILREFAFKPDSPWPTRTLLLLDHTETEGEGYTSYQAEVTTILSAVREAGFHLVLKPHPRLGASRFLGPFVHDTVPDEIPAQFIDHSSYLAVIGTHSGAMIDFALAGKPVVSFEKLLATSNVSHRNYIIDMLCSNDRFPSKPGPIRFAASLGEFLQMIKQLT